MGWTRQNHLLDNSSSTLSSQPMFVGDCNALTLSIATSSTSASLFTVRGSNGNGFQSAIPDYSWSVLTAIPNAGIYLIAPGVRWIFVERANFNAVSAASMTTIVLERQRWE